MTLMDTESVSVRGLGNLQCYFLNGSLTSFSSRSFFILSGIRLNAPTSVSCVAVSIFHDDHQKFALPNLVLWPSVIQLIFQKHFLHIFFI